MDKENMKKLDDEMLGTVVGGAGEGTESYDFDKIAREMVLADKGCHNRLEKAVGRYKIVVMTNFSYDQDFGTFMGSYSYTVYDGEIVVKTGREGDFVM